MKDEKYLLLYSNQQLQSLLLSNQLQLLHNELFGNTIVVIFSLTMDLIWMDAMSLSYLKHVLHKISYYMIIILI